MSKWGWNYQNDAELYHTNTYRTQFTGCHLPFQPTAQPPFTLGCMGQHFVSYQYLPVEVIYYCCTFQTISHHFHFLCLRNDHFRNTVGQDKEFKINEAGKWHSEKQQRHFLFHARVLFLKNVVQIKQNSHLKQCISWVFGDRQPHPISCTTLPLVDIQTCRV